MTFDEWMRSRSREKIDWLTESEILLKNGLIPCEGCETHRNNQGTDFRMCPFRPNAASNCGRARRTQQAYLFFGGKPET